MATAIADAALSRPEAHLYGPVLGNRDLREAVAGTSVIRLPRPQEA